MGFGIRAEFEELREVSFGSITSDYTLLGEPLEDYARVIGFYNATDQHIKISFDGVKDNVRLANNSFRLYDLSSNKIRDDGLVLPKRTQIFIKYATDLGTSGDFWAEVIFGSGGK